MYKTAILHMGYDKSGSTALQSTSMALRSQLQHLGIHFPEPSIGSNHKFIASAFFTNPTQTNFNKEMGRSNRTDAEIRLEDRRLLSAYQKKIEDGWGTLFLSFEGFIWLSESEHIRLRDWVLKFAPSVKVLLYVRDPAGYAVSAISQRVRTGRSVRIGSHYHDLNIPKLIKVYGRDNVMVREFGRQALQGGDVRYDCYSLMGLESRQIKKLLSQTRNITSSPNQSLSMDAIGVGEALRKQLKGTKLQGTTEAEWIFPRVFGNLLDGIPGPKYSLSIPQELFLFAQPRVWLSSRYLLDEFGIDFRWQAKRLFSPSRRVQLRQRNRFKALRRQGHYAKLASTLIDQMSSEIKMVETTSFGDYMKSYVHKGDTF